VGKSCLRIHRTANAHSIAIPVAITSRGPLRRNLNMASSQPAAVHRVPCSLLMYYYLSGRSDLVKTPRNESAVTALRRQPLLKTNVGMGAVYAMCAAGVAMMMVSCRDQRPVRMGSAISEQHAVLFAN
jgi:hypothetical protein